MKHATTDVFYMSEQTGEINPSKHKPIRMPTAAFSPQQLFYYCMYSSTVTQTCSDLALFWCRIHFLHLGQFVYCV